jgi:TolA-binding protein
MKFLASLALALLLTGCFQTAEEIRREQRVSQVDQELQQSRVTVAEMSTKHRELQDQINMLNGKIEEMTHQKNQLSDGQVSQITQLLTGQKAEIEELRLQLKKQSDATTEMQEKLKIQTAYLQEVTQGLDNLSSTPKTKSKKEKKKDKSAEVVGDSKDFPSKLKLVEEQIQAGKLAEAGALCESIIQDSAYSAGKHNQCRFKLGEIAYKKKNYEDALVYFSKIYTQWPKSSLAPESRFFNCQNFQRPRENK